MDGVVNIAAQQSLVSRLLGRVDECFLGSVCAES